MRRGRRTAESRHGHGGARQQTQPMPYTPPYQPYYEPTGQRVIKHEDQKSEVETPWMQATKAVKCRAIQYLVISAVVVLLSIAFYIAIDRYVVFVIGGVLIVVSGVILYRQVDWKVIAPLVLSGLIGVSALGALFVCSDIVIGWKTWQLLIAFWLAGLLSYAVLPPMAAALWRYIAEVYDPNGPTATKLPERRGGVRYPWTLEENVGGDELEQIREMLEQVLRYAKTPQPTEVLRPVEGNWGNGGNGGGRRRYKGDGHYNRPDPVPYGRVAIKAPTSGRRVPLEMLVTFLRKSEQVGTGAREWKVLDDWDEDRWGDVIEIWSRVIGVFEPGKPGKSGRFTTTRDVAMMRLLSWVNDDRPTPAESVRTENITPGQTGQDSETG